MKKTFWILWVWLLLASNILTPFNATAADKLSCDVEVSEEKWCYVFSHKYYDCGSTKLAVNNGPIYMGTEIKRYKCDAGWWTVDLSEAPLENGQYIAWIWENAFAWTNVTKVIVPSTVKQIWDWAFCDVIKELVPVCWNGIIESWEECDNWPINWTSTCDLYCKTLLTCGNWEEDEWETCHNCPGDVVCMIKGMPIDDPDFVELEFPNGMDPWFDTTSLDDACGKMHEYTVTFDTEDGDTIKEASTKYQYIDIYDIPSMSEEEWLYGGWYLWDELFVLNSQISENITLVYKYKTGWIEYDNENWRFIVSLWDQEVIVKDKDQLAYSEAVLDKLTELQGEYTICYGASKTKSLKYTEINNDNNENCRAGSDILQEASDLLGVDISNASDLLNFTPTHDWKYYFRWNNVWLNIDQALDENGDIDMTKIPEWFDHGYIWLEWWNNWNVWSKDTPCNPDSWEYLPSPDDWKTLMQLWWRLNWYEVLYDLNWWYILNELITKGAANIRNEFANNFWLWMTLPSLYIDWWVDYRDFIHYQSSMKDWNIWYITSNWLYLIDSNDSEFVNDMGLNNLAMPVRCFIQPQFEVSFNINGWSEVETQLIFSWNSATEPEIQKENADFLWWYTADWTRFDFSTLITSDIVLEARWQDKKPSSGYSGRWSSGGSSSSRPTTTVDIEHNSGGDKTDSSAREATENDKNNIEDNQSNTEDNNKSRNENNENGLSNRVAYVPDNNLPEMEQAYNFSHSYWITTEASVKDAQMNGPLTRIQMAKMLSNFAMNVLWRQPDLSKWTLKFNDVTNNLDKEYDNAVTISYQLWIMGQNMPNNMFRPNDIVTRAEFVAAFSRMMYWTSDWEYKSTSKYYTHHMEKLKNEKVLTNTNPSLKEKRWYVMIMLMRSVK